MLRYVFGITIVFVLACSGGTPDVQGVWCTQKDTWSCWAFEGNQVTYVWKWDKPDKPLDQAPFRIEGGDTILMEWDKHVQIFRIIDQIPSSMQVYDVEGKQTHMLIRRDALRKPEGS